MQGTRMISSAFIWQPGTYNAEFEALDKAIQELAESIPGFLGVERWNSDDRTRRNAVYYWESMDDLKILQKHPKHLEAKRRYKEWYKGLHVVISEVLQSYGDDAFSHITPNSRNQA
jgi:heme-degrading monooxygenase HmoA